jgi:hypothetical protein
MVFIICVILLFPLLFDVKNLKFLFFQNLNKTSQSYTTKKKHSEEEKNKVHK